MKMTLREKYEIKKQASLLTEEVKRNKLILEYISKELIQHKNMLSKKLQAIDNFISKSEDFNTEQGVKGQAKISNTIEKLKAALKTGTARKEKQDLSAEMDSDPSVVAAAAFVSTFENGISSVQELVTQFFGSDVRITADYSLYDLATRMQGAPQGKKKNTDASKLEAELKKLFIADKKSFIKSSLNTVKSIGKKIWGTLSGKENPLASIDSDLNVLGDVLPSILMGKTIPQISQFVNQFEASGSAEEVFTNTVNDILPNDGVLDKIEKDLGPQKAPTIPATSADAERKNQTPPPLPPDAMRRKAPSAGRSAEEPRDASREETNTPSAGENSRANTKVVPRSNLPSGRPEPRFDLGNLPRAPARAEPPAANIPALSNLKLPPGAPKGKNLGPLPQPGSDKKTPTDPKPEPNKKNKDTDEFSLTAPNDMTDRQRLTKQIASDLKEKNISEDHIESIIDWLASKNKLTEALKNGSLKLVVDYNKLRNLIK